MATRPASSSPASFSLPSHETPDRFTPGPWAVHPFFSLYVVPAAHCDRPCGFAEDDARDRAEYAQLIADTGTSERRRSLEEQRANARLIAAAPELLDALKNLIAWIDLVESNRDFQTTLLIPQYVAAVTAITKAEGR